MRPDNVTESNPGTTGAPLSLREIGSQSQRIRQDRIRRVKDKYESLGLKAHRGTIARVAMGRPLTATQLYRLQSQIPKDEKS